MVRFGLDALQIIEDINNKLNAFLAVRIGVNTGGPVLAGVLGTDRPVLDIIGDPINVAARLQSTDVPGKVQVSEDTHSLVQGMDFQIEFRGEVELQGKGKKKTYLVDPNREPTTPVGSSTSLEDVARFVPSEAAKPN
jgi:class 3 adenylate cyclase